MPCTYEDPDSSLNRVHQEAQSATRAACDMRTILRRHGLEKHLTAETRVWIAKHDEVDKHRIKEEEAAGIRQKTREKGLSKLTLDERRALGL